MRAAGAGGGSYGAAPASPSKLARLMSDFKHKEAERLSRQQAAERLIDIAYALTAGGPLAPSAAGQRGPRPAPHPGAVRAGRARRAGHGSGAQRTAAGTRAEVERRPGRARAGAQLVDSEG